MIIPSN